MSRANFAPSAKLDKVSEMSGELDEISAIAEILAEEADAELEEESTRAPKNFQKR